MSKNDYAIEVDFRLQEGTSADQVSRLIDRVMASVGFHFYRTPGTIGDRTAQQTAEIDHHFKEIHEYLSRTALPTAAYGWPIKSLPWWESREFLSFDSKLEPGEFCRTLHYSLDSASIGIVEDLEKAGNSPLVESYSSEADERTPYMDWDQYFFYFREIDRDGFEVLHLRTQVLRGYAEHSSLDRFWTLVLRDVVMQFHQALKSHKTSLTVDNDGLPFFTITEPSNPEFWPPGMYQFLPSGDAKVDAVLDAYEQELRDDPMRVKVLSQEV